MSSVRTRYEESYRFIRVMMGGGFDLPPIVADWESHFRPFMFALVSYDNRRIDPRVYKWLNWYRREQFYARMLNVIDCGPF